MSDNFPEPTAETIKRPLVHHPGTVGGDILYASMSAAGDAAQLDVIDASGEHPLWGGEFDERNARALGNALTARADQLATAQGDGPASDGAGRTLTTEYRVMTPHGPHPAHGTKLTLDQAQSAIESDGGADLSVAYRTRTVITTAWVFVGERPE